MASPRSPLTVGPDEEPGGAPLTSWYTQGVTDGFGDRLLMFDNAATGPVELLRVRHDFAVVPGFETALRQRFSALASFVHPGFAHTRVVNHLENGGGLTVASSHVTGTRLAALFDATRPTPGMHPGAVREVFGDLVASIADLHKVGPDIAHGALSADRVILTFDRRLVVTDYVFGSALARLNLPAARLWSEFGLVRDEQSARVHLDQRGDLTQLGLLMLCLVLGRRVTPDEYPQRIPALLDEFARASDRRAPDLTAPMAAWLEQSLDPSGFESVAEAGDVLTMWPPRPLYVDLHAPAPRALETAPVSAPQDEAPAESARADAASDVVSEPVPTSDANVAPVVPETPAPPVEALEAAASPALPVLEPTTSAIDTPLEETAAPLESAHARLDEPVSELQAASYVDANTEVDTTTAERDAEDAVAASPSEVEAHELPAPHLAAAAEPAPLTSEDDLVAASDGDATSPLEVEPSDVVAESIVTESAVSGSITDTDTDTDTDVLTSLAAVIADIDAGPRESLNVEPELSLRASEPETSDAIADTDLLMVREPAPAAVPEQIDDIEPLDPDFDDIDARFNPRVLQLEPGPASDLIPHPSSLLKDLPSTDLPAVTAPFEPPRLDTPLLARSQYSKPASAGSFILPDPTETAQADAPGAMRFIKLASKPRHEEPSPAPQLSLERPATPPRPEPFAWASPAQVEPEIEPDASTDDVPSGASPLLWWVIAALVTLIVGQGAIIMQLMSRQSRATITRVHVDSGTPGDTVLLDGRDIGVTPLDVQLPSAESVVQVIPRVKPAAKPAPSPADATDDATSTSPTATAVAAAGTQQPNASKGRTGGIRVVSPIPLQVMDGKEFLGSSDRGPVYTSPGQHTLDFVNNNLGFRTTQRVQTVAGQLVAVRVNPPNGSLSVTAQPSAQVWIDGRSAGATPVANLSLALGEHEVVVRHPTLGERSQRALVRANEPTRVSVSFNP